MEVGELSRAIGQPWSRLWPKVRKLEERKDVGRALSADEQKALLDGLQNRRTPHISTLVPLLLLTGMRAGEALSLIWGRVDLMDKTLRVGRAKTSNGTGRVIPINDDLGSVLAAHRTWFIEKFGVPRPEHYLFPWGKGVPSDPTRHITDITWAWDRLRAPIRVSSAACMTSGIVPTSRSCRLFEGATRLARGGYPLDSGNPYRLWFGLGLS
jgi:integrase